nr:MAG TPA: hypothetical protein [Caudoviricetes sp.]
MPIINNIGLLACECHINVRAPASNKAYATQ